MRLPDFRFGLELPKRLLVGNFPEGLVRRDGKLQTPSFRGVSKCAARIKNLTPLLSVPGGLALRSAARSK